MLNYYDKDMKLLERVKRRKRAEREKFARWADLARSQVVGCEGKG
jgi:hypothetical protein